jgi:biotin carboxylase
MTFASKRLLILGGNPDTAVFVQHANTLGIHTVVVDPNPEAPAKDVAADRYDINVFDVDAIVGLARKLVVDGVMVGVADVLVAPYREICAKLGLPCYASADATDAFSSKDAFNAACARYGVPTVPGGVVSRENRSYLDEVHAFPMVVKPVDSGAGVGMRVCYGPLELPSAIDSALACSRRGVVLVEQYMDCPDMFAYYSIVRGKGYLSATADRITSTKNPGLSKVCIGAIYPSKHTPRFQREVNPRVLAMIEGLGLQAGVLNIQFFVREDGFFAYDPGFRLQGEAPHLPLAAINGFDHRTMLCRFALTGDMVDADFEASNDINLRGFRVLTVWILLHAGVIHSISGLDELHGWANVISVQQRFLVGDEVKADMIGTERQVLARIHIRCNPDDDIKATIRSVRSLIRVSDESGEDMIADWISEDAL